MRSQPQKWEGIPVRNASCQRGPRRCEGCWWGERSSGLRRRAVHKRQGRPYLCVKPEYGHQLQTGRSFPVKGRVWGSRYCYSYAATAVAHQSPSEIIRRVTPLKSVLIPNRLPNETGSSHGYAGGWSFYICLDGSLLTQLRVSAASKTLIHCI